MISLCVKITSKGNFSVRKYLVTAHQSKILETFYAGLDNFHHAINGKLLAPADIEIFYGLAVVRYVVQSCKTNKKTREVKTTQWHWR